MQARVLVTPGSWVAEIQELLEGLGARVQILAPDQDWRLAYRRATHILIPGGADIAPSAYGEETIWARPGGAVRDRVELPLARRALADGKPLMGICRGHQVIAVAAGGSLYQDIGQALQVEHTARQHGIRINPRSRVGQVLGVIAQVNSYHHQAVKRVPSGWRVVAESLDGMVVEAIEHPGLPVLSVQWHPEVLGDWELFEAFLGMRG